MANISSKVHLGKIIRERVNKSGLTITEFAQKINLSRPAVYQMFKKKSIDTDLLVRISLLLNENICEILHNESKKLLINYKNLPHTDVEISEKERVDKNEENYLNLMKKIEIIHQDLLSIKNILQEMKTLQEMKANN